MNNIFIIYESFYDKDGIDFRIGGIQTYIRYLVEVVCKAYYNPIIVQFANGHFHNRFNGTIDVYGVDVTRRRSLKQKVLTLLDFVKAKFSKGDLLIFATDTLYVPTFTKRVVAIQHGVYWDLPSNKFRSALPEVLLRAIKSYYRIRRQRGLQHIVCVDNNYINWLRTQFHWSDLKLHYIPNCVKCFDWGMETKCTVEPAIRPLKVIFARRFVEMRGTRMFANVAEWILDKYNNVEITFAGGGPDGDFLMTRFKDYPRVKFISYSSTDSISVHEDYDIAVVPSIGSEGTSLSLLEAMAAGCAVVASNVGGITNIVLDNYNGLLVNPDETSLFISLAKLIEDKTLRERLSKNAVASVTQAFSFEMWCDKWLKVIGEVSLLP